MAEGGIGVGVAFEPKFWGEEKEEKRADKRGRNGEEARG